jgi:predicted DCC family thiol-disulfide oxidoreductase YuxK
MLMLIAVGLAAPVPASLRDHPYNRFGVTTMNPTTAAATATTDRAIVLFDGECNLCNRSVRFVLARDPGDHFRFASLQSDTGRALLEKHQVNDAGAAENGGSIVLIENGRPFTRSTAALKIARHLGGTWPLLSALLIIPRPLRDAVYNFIARHRYRWFGKTTDADACPIDPAAAAALRGKMLQ